MQVTNKQRSVGEKPSSVSGDTHGNLLNEDLYDEAVGGFKHFLYFHPYFPGKMIQLDEDIFQMGW